jgi:hypothetical protein
MRQKMPTTETKSEHIVASFSFVFGPRQARRKKGEKRTQSQIWTHYMNKDEGRSYNTAQAGFVLSILYSAAAPRSDDSEFAFFDCG